MTTPAIWPSLRRILVAIGRWVLDRIVRSTVLAVVWYMRGKVEDFKRRLARARSDRRKRWLRGRIRRWTRAAGWLETWRHELADRTTKAACKQLATKLPEQAAQERKAA